MQAAWYRKDRYRNHLQMMSKNHWLFISIASSFLVHIIFISFFSVYVGAKQSPVIYSWPDILRKKELLTSNAQVSPPEEAAGGLNDLGRRYFSQAFNDKSGFVLDNEYMRFVSVPSQKGQDYNTGDIQSKEKNTYFYLWEREPLFTTFQEERVSFKVLVSPHGKAIISFPEKLLSEAYEGILLQEYIREATFFIKDKFFWTKLERIVK